MINVALVGISGYGDSYLDVLLNEAHAGRLKLVGVVDPAPTRSDRLGELQGRHIAVHPTLEHLFSTTKQEIGLVMIATPIHLHASQSCLALRNGCSVLCEKPLAGSLADAMGVAAAAAAAPDQFVAIGFQWSFSKAVQSLKRDIMGGVLGRPIRMRTLVFFPRPAKYFSRNDWAGRIYSRSGESVLDSPVNNATSHYLHNMFYLLGATRQASAMPATVHAELYRANRIENYDTAALRCRTECGVEILFYTTHCTAERVGPKSIFEFEEAVVEYDPAGAGGDQFVARFRDGRVKSYGRPNEDRNEKLWQCVDAVKFGQPVACGVAASLPHTLCATTAQQSPIHDFPVELQRIVPIDGDPTICVEGLDSALLDCHGRGILPAEHGGLRWARKAPLLSVPETELDLDLERSPAPAGPVPA